MTVSLISSDTLLIDGAPATPVLAGTIIVASGANPLSGAVSTAKAVGLIGITAENTDAKGYARVATQPGSIVDCIAGAAVAYGNLIASNAAGQGIPVTALGAGALTQIVGVADSAASGIGIIFQVRLLPTLGLS